MSTLYVLPSISEKANKITIYRRERTNEEEWRNKRKKWREKEKFAAYERIIHIQQRTPKKRDASLFMWNLMYNLLYFNKSIYMYYSRIPSQSDAMRYVIRLFYKISSPFNIPFDIAHIRVHALFRQEQKTGGEKSFFQHV